MTSPEFQQQMQAFASTYEGTKHYCLKCREHTPMQNVRLQWSKNGVPTAKGTCQTCGSGMNRTLPRTPPQQTP